MTKDQTIVRERMTSMSTPLLLFRGVDIIFRKSKHVVRGHCCMRGRLYRSACDMPSRQSGKIDLGKSDSNAGVLIALS